MAQIELSADVNMIWHLLVSRGKSTDEELEEVLDESVRNGQSFQRVLYNYDIISEDNLLQLVAEELGTEFVEIPTSELDEDLINSITPDVARTYGIIPISQTEDTITVVAENPFDPRLIDELHFVLNKDCQVLVAREKDVLDALDLFYPEKGGSITDVIEEMGTFYSKDDKDLDLSDEKDLAKAANEAPIVRFVNVILQQAIKDKASDIHFEPFADEFRIRYRIDGALYEMAPPPKHLAVPIISRIKVMSGLNIAERRLPQDGRIELRVNRRPIDLRVSSLPTRYGESVVLRVLDRSVVSLSFDNLGMTPKMVNSIRSMISQPNGIFLVTGPTGSGKTTTLYSGLRELNTLEDKLLTAEDPVEYDIEGIMQVPVRENIGMTFSKALRAFLRQDPDRIMVGEMRDVETASIAIQASLTGHFVLSTLHTNDAAGAVTRLIDMGIEPFLISSTVIGVLAQRLIRRCCYNCKEPYIPDDKELRMLGITRDDIDNKPFYRGHGCEICNGSGYKGRVGIFELLSISESVQGMINRKMPSQDIKRQALEEGMTTLRKDGINQILQGVTTAAEVIQYTLL